MTLGKIRIATRGSALALAQTRLIADRLIAAHPETQIELVTIQTRGDQEQTTPLWKLEGYGFFTSQVEAALLDDRADMAVHSFKDMPTQCDNRLTVASVFERLYPEDVAVAASRIHRLPDLSEGAIVGTSSPRRIAQLKALRPDLDIRPLRGNIETRLQKVFSGQYDAVILARAGLERLGLADKIAFRFDPTVFVPAPAQGSLAIQIRIGDFEVQQVTACLNDTFTAITVNAERTVLSALHPGCHAPVGVYARIVADELEIIALAAGMEGFPCLRRQVRGPINDSTMLAAELVEQLRHGGVEAILKPFEDKP